jgi:ubiquitin-conjugating enzyme E2 A
MSIATLRLTKELNKLITTKNDIIEVVDNLDNEFKSQIVIKKPDNLYEWSLKIKGPSDSPFENGFFDVLIRFDSDYPVKPPSVKFLSTLYHPNIYRDGKICIDILQPHEWVSTQTVRTIMLSIISLLCDPNPASPANREAAELYVKDKNAYNEKVKQMIVSQNK